MNFKEFYINERSGSTFRNLIVVDVQPEYEDAIKQKFSLEEFGDFLLSIHNKILYFYNGKNVGSKDTPKKIKSWLNISEETNKKTSENCNSQIHIYVY